jgi:hypothetical protein
MIKILETLFDSIKEHLDAVDETDEKTGNEIEPAAG